MVADPHARNWAGANYEAQAQGDFLVFRRVDGSMECAYRAKFVHYGQWTNLVRIACKMDNKNTVEASYIQDNRIFVNGLKMTNTDIWLGTQTHVWKNQHHELMIERRDHAGWLRVTYQTHDWGVGDTRNRFGQKVENYLGYLYVDTNISPHHNVFAHEGLCMQNQGTPTADRGLMLRGEAVGQKSYNGVKPSPKAIAYGKQVCSGQNFKSEDDIHNCIQDVALTHNAKFAKLDLEEEEERQRILKVEKQKEKAVQDTHKCFQQCTNTPKVSDECKAVWKHDDRDCSEKAARLKCGKSCDGGKKKCFNTCSMVKPDCGKDGLDLPPMRVCKEECFVGPQCLTECTKREVALCQIERIPGFFQAKCQKVLDSTQFKGCFTKCVKDNQKCLATCTSTNVPAQYKDCTAFYQGDLSRQCSLAHEVQKCDKQCYAGGKKCEKQCKDVMCGGKKINTCKFVCGTGSQFCEKLCSKKKMQKCWIQKVPEDLAAKCMQFIQSAPVTKCLNKCFFPTVLPH